jgi:hypothetical protein
MSFHAILVDVVQMPSFGTTQCKRNHGRGRLVAASHCPDRPIWFEARPRAVRDLDSQLVCVRGTSQDVTEQQRAIRAWNACASANDATPTAIGATGLPSRC